MIQLPKETCNLYDYQILKYKDGEVLHGFCPEYNDQHHPVGDYRRGVYITTSRVVSINESGILPLAKTCNTFYILHEESHPEGQDDI